MNYIPLRARRGLRVHITHMSDGRKTVCGLDCSGWIVESCDATCLRCLQLVARAQ